MNRPEQYSTDYGIARNRFLEAAHAADARIESSRNPHTGPKDEPLFMDVVMLGAETPRRTLIIGSGTHGVEGFVGSDIQSRLLEDGIWNGLPPDLGLLLIHGINPYGMAHLRRVNEDNVDLNRNFRNHLEPTPSNPDYERLADAIAPKSMSFWSEMISWSRILAFRTMAGSVLSQAAFSGGQYSHPNGLFYGGTFESWSNKAFRNVLRRYVTEARHIVFIDIHTGLGEFGAAEVLIHSSEDALDYQWALETWGPDLLRSTVTGVSVSPYINTTVKHAVTSMLTETDLVVAVSLEFGTVSTLRAFRALRAENWHYHHGDSAESNDRQLKECLLRAFHPDSVEWETAVWNYGKIVIDNALSGLSS